MSLQACRVLIFPVPLGPHLQGDLPASFRWAFSEGWRPPAEGPQRCCSQSQSSLSVGCLLPIACDRQMKSRAQGGPGKPAGLRLRWVGSCHPMFLVSTVCVLSFSIFNAGRRLRMRRGWEEGRCRIAFSSVRCVSGGVGGGLE